jgi:DNA replication and repair protein RecF
MFLKSLKLTNFRNYSTIDFDFKKKITVLRGDNAQGKTNFLEGVYYLATAHSVRADRDEELIKDGEEVLRVEGVVLTNQVNQKEEVGLEIVMQSSEGRFTKRVKVNGIARRVSDYAENLVTVLFRPEDINLVTGSPSLRREFIDQAISQVDKSYKRTVSTYENLLVRKNRVLKRIREGFARADELDYWIDQQVMLGALIQQKREEFFNFLNTVERKFGEYEFKYIESELNTDRLKDYRIREIESASSLIGPQRDDLLFLLEGKDLSKYGSRGEQRTAVLDLKIAEAEFVEEKLGDRPVLLLDDIFSELDIAHRKHVVELADIQQTIIATVDWDENLKDALKNAKIVTVKGGILGS